MTGSLISGEDNSEQQSVSGEWKAPLHHQTDANLQNDIQHVYMMLRKVGLTQVGLKPDFKSPCKHVIS